MDLGIPLPIAKIGDLVVVDSLEQMWVKSAWFNESEKIWIYSSDDGGRHGARSWTNEHGILKNITQDELNNKE